MTDAVLNGADTAWILTSTALVLMMVVPGLCLFYSGLVKTRNVLSIFVQIFLLIAVLSTVWILWGYSLAFGESYAVVGSLSQFGLIGMGREDINGTIPSLLFVAFQMMFAVITPALIIGGFAERMSLRSVLIFSVLWLTIVYAPICHWVWGGGWLSELGVMDYAGGLVVHETAGVAALVIALMIGPRYDFVKGILPHNLPLVAVGTGLLWVGWFGFNGGSALAANGDAASAILATHLGACAGVAIWSLMEYNLRGKVSLLGAATGAIAGLGAITPASGFVGPFGGIVIGALAGFLAFKAVFFIKVRLKIDDSLDVFPVHGIGGILGSLAVPFLALESVGGVGFDNTLLEQIGVQLLGVVVVGVWTAVGTYLCYRVSDLAPGGARVELEAEEIGLDIHSHGETGYNL